MALRTEHTLKKTHNQTRHEQIKKTSSPLVQKTHSTEDNGNQRFPEDTKKWMNMPLTRFVTHEVLEVGSVSHPFLFMLWILTFLWTT